MLNKNTFKFLILTLLILSLATVGFSQRRKSKAKTVKNVNKPVIFAVINDGKTIEPIAFIDGKKLVKAVMGDDDQKAKENFSKTYFQNKNRYKLIFSGVNSGVVTVKSNDYKSECASNLAEVTTISANTKLKGFVMGLATDFRTVKTASGTRRLPTPSERNKFENIIKQEFTKKNITNAQLGSMKYHNLTAVDVDDTGIVELVGSFWVDISPTERGLMFMIVDIEKTGKLTMNLSKYSTIKQGDVMNQEIETVDSGTYHELLLDYFDYDNDGVSEIFTIVQGFEGTSFNVYERKKDQWVIAYEFANYHCGF